MIRLIILIIIIIAVLSYFNISIKNFIESRSFQENFHYVLNGIKYMWSNYLKRPALYLWNDIFIRFIWEPLINNLERIKGGQSLIEKLFVGRCPFSTS